MKDDDINDSIPNAAPAAPDRRAPRRKGKQRAIEVDQTQEAPGVLQDDSTANEDEYPGEVKSSPAGVPALSRTALPRTTGPLSAPCLPQPIRMVPATITDQDLARVDGLPDAERYRRQREMLYMTKHLHPGLRAAQARVEEGHARASRQLADLWARVADASSDEEELPDDDELLDDRRYED